MASTISNFVNRESLQIRNFKYLSQFMSMPKLFIAILAVGLLAGMLFGGTVHAAGITVTTTVDEFGVGTDTGCSLREAIQAAQTDSEFGGCPAGSGWDTISVPAGTYILTLGDLDIGTNLDIIGDGPDATIIDGGGIDRVFYIHSGIILLKRLTVQNGKATYGGGIYNHGGTLYIEESTIRNNVALRGGGIFNKGTLSITKSTIESNEAVYGGGILNSGFLTISESTLTSNSAVWDIVGSVNGGYGGGIYAGIDNFGTYISESTLSENDAEVGGGIYIKNGLVVITGSTLSGNTAIDGGGIFIKGEHPNFSTLHISGSTFSENWAIDGGGILGTSDWTHITLKNTIINSARGYDCKLFRGAFISSLGYNLTHDTSCNLTEPGDQQATNPLLGPLQDNGGPTETHALLAGSLAIDAGNPATPGSVEEGACEATDQRGISRPQGTSCDIGAYEVVVIAEDTEDPTWSLPADITISTEPGVSTAVVVYTATPSDNVGVVSSSCTPASGDTFSLGVTTVYCTATDADGNEGTASFNVTVEDNEDPTWSAPVADFTVNLDLGSSTEVAADIADITVDATSLLGAEVSYPATASDNVGVVSSSCTQSSGSTFSLGTTTVECTASDAAGNVGTASFTVTVEVNTGSIGTLIEEIKNMDLSKNVEKTLIGPLKNAAKKMEDNNPDNDEAACDKFDEFLSLVQEAWADGNITQTQAHLLSAFGQAIKDYLNCP